MRRLAFLPAWLLACTASAQSIAPPGEHQFFDNNGVILANGKLFTYAGGTTTKVVTYKNSTLTTPNTDPIILDASGRATIFLPAATWRFVLAPANDTDPPANAFWTVDNVTSIPPATTNTDVPATFAVSVTAGQAVYLSDGSGALNAGQWYLADNTNAYSSTQAPMLGVALTTVGSGLPGMVRVIGRPTNLSGLTAGTTYYLSTAGTLTSSIPGSLPVKFIVADSATSGVISEFPQEASATLRGIVSELAQSFAGTKTLLATARYQPGSSVTAFPWNGRLNVQATASGNGNAANANSTLFTYTIPAGTLTTPGAVLKVTMIGTAAANGNLKSVGFTFGSSTIQAGTVSRSGSGGWLSHLYVYVVSSSSQVLILTEECGGGSGNCFGAGEALQGPISSSQTATNAIVLTGTGGDSTTGSANDIVAYFFLVEVVGA